MDESSTPSDIYCRDQAFSLSFHPIGEYLACGVIDGSIEIWQYGLGDSGNSLVFRSKNHTSSCRGLKFSSDGEHLFSVSSDKSIRCLDGNCSEIFSLANAHTTAINRLDIVSNNVLVTGDDGGVVKVWDTRAMSSVMNASMEWHSHEDYVSGLAFNESTSSIVSVSGDSTFCTYDLRNPSHCYRSEQQGCDLHCADVMNNGGSLILGGETGEIVGYDWERWDTCSVRITGHPESVDCMWKVDESTVMTGSSDGLIRVVSLLPNKVLGVVGDHEEFPVEGMCASRDGRLLASFAHDEVVRFWDIASALEECAAQFDQMQQQGSGASMNEHLSFSAGLL